MTSASERIAAWAANLEFEMIPVEVRERAKLHLLDAIGCGIAAYGLGAAAAIRRIVLGRAGLNGSPVIGVGPGFYPSDAALANGALMHALDFDDTHPASSTHITAVVAAAALAAGADQRASGETTLTAIVAGSEAMAQVALVAPWQFHRRGYHPTGVLGPFGAAVAASRIHGHEASAMANALGIAGSLGAGINEYLSDGSQTKPLHVGWAAHAGLAAAALAGAGMTGPRRVLEGERGLYATHLGLSGVASDEIVAGLGVEWETARLAIKAYPVCHAMSGCLDAVLEIRAAHPALNSGEIERIDVSLCDRDAQLVIEPIDDKRKPQSLNEMRFSLPVALAWTLLHGPPTLSNFDEQALGDRAVMQLASRVFRGPQKPVATAAYPGDVTIWTRAGECLHAAVARQRGNPDRPLSADEVVAKFRGNVRFGISTKDTKLLAERILGLERLSDVAAALGDLFAPIAVA